MLNFYSRLAWRRVIFPSTSSSNTTVTSFDEHYFHELDTVNFLSSGKQWWGEELSALPGSSTTRTWKVSMPGMMLQKKQDSTYRSLGETVREAKNYTYRFSGDMVNNRKFALLGDPALTPGFPIQQVRITAVNGKAPATVPDTLKAMARYDMEGVVTDNGGNVLNDFNGTVYPLVFDKPVTISTRANNAGSIKTDFQVQRSVLFRGKATVANGRFTFSFIAPRDIGYRFGMGKISRYAENGKADAGGWLGNMVVGGSGGLLNDKTGPDIRLFLNDQKFVSGGMANERPLNFWFDHNRPGEELRISIQVYTVSRKLVKTLRRTIISSGNRSCEVEWDGRDEYGGKLGQGCIFIASACIQVTEKQRKSLKNCIYCKT